MKSAVAIASACAILLFCNSSAAQTQYIIGTVAGGGLPPTPIAGTNAGFEFIHSVITDPAGSVYFTADNAVFKLDPAGVLTRVAGRSRLQGYSGDGWPATSAQLNLETTGGTAGLAVDSAGNRYIADQYNHVIRRVAPNGIISTVAGSGLAGYAGDNGPALAARLNNPIDVAVDAAGNLFILDSTGNGVRKVTAGGVITTVAGNPLASGYGGDGGPAVNALLNFATGIAIDPAGNLFISDQYNSRIRKVALNGTITTVAGNGMDASSGDGGPASSASIARPRSVSVDNSGNLYITGGCRVRKIATSGMITTVAGNGVCGNAPEGQPALNSTISPVGAAMDSACNLYIADTGGGVIRKVGPDGILRNAAGHSGSRFSGDGGAATSAQFHYVHGVAADRLGNLFIADSGDNRVRRMSPDGTIVTIAGNGTYSSSGDGGPASAATMQAPSAVLPDAAGNLYIAEFSRIRKVAPNGIITTFAGSGFYGDSGDNGPATNAAINFPRALALDASGNLYIADGYNHRIRKVGANGIITTVAGTGCAGYAGDGGPAVNALLNFPTGLAIDVGGNLYISEWNNQRVRKVTPNGIITTVAGTGAGGFSGDGGAAINAQLNDPDGIAVDAAGNLYIADGSGRIRQVTPAGTISTIAGGWAQGYAGDGAIGVYAKLFVPAAVATDTSGNIYVGDGGIIRVLTPVGGSPILSASLSHPGNFEAGQAGATYSVMVSNHAFAGAAGGPVTVTEIVPNGLTLVSMSGTGWNCLSNSCTRSDPLAPVASYPPITVTVNVASNVAAQALNQVTVTATHAVPSGTSDLTSTPGLSEPVLSSPSNAATGVSANLTLNWSAVAGATSYDVYFGATAQPALLTNTTGTSYSLSGLSPATAYHWRIVARGGVLSASSVIWLFTTTGGKAGMLSPAPGSTLAASSLTFTWSASAGASAYWLDVGTVQGQGTIFGRNVGLVISQAVTGLPSSGVVYVRLWTQLNGVWQYNDYTYIASVLPVKAVIASPTPGATLHATETFSWTPGSGATAYWLDVGTVQGQGNIFGNNVGLAQSQTVNGIPTSAGTIYVRLWSQLSGNWVYNDYTYTAVTLNTKAVMASPPPGSTLPGASAKFTWTAAAGASAYWLDAGTVQGQGSIFAGNLGLSLSQAVSSIPTTGGTIYVRLWTLQSGTWSYNDYTYTAATLGTKAVMVNPAPASTLSGASVTFTWSPGSGATAYWLDVGTSQGQGNIYAANLAPATSQTIGGLPTTGGTIFVRLWTQQSGAWSYNDYTYIAATLAAKAVLVSPAPGSTLNGASVTFAWSSAAGASAYWLDVGTAQGQGAIFGNNVALATSQAVTGIPTAGATIYVRLWTQQSNVWSFNDYTYTAATLGAKAVMLSPAPGSTLSGTSVTFTWSAGTGASAYWLDVGTVQGQGNVFGNNINLATSQTVAGIPTDGRTIYVRLWTQIGGAWQVNDYSYAAFH